MCRNSASVWSPTSEITKSFKTVSLDSSRTSLEKKAAILARQEVKEHCQEKEEIRLFETLMDALGVLPLWIGILRSELYLGPVTLLLNRNGEEGPRRNKEKGYEDRTFPLQKNT